ncbi:MAG: hypothetical protein AW09_000714 [Candidatus Accumulibacter phosphatis]|jgi:hypothetical protein|uniref:Uncharacterized protein n=1 Tax=Candidatus Accumulibacter phosphatis TaxID=327160 RepID=A0A080LYQ8_9PROT|nr:MAG: hypothetical protein AW09_000714 [Candidatus Accumulibacter phosphatis]
MSCEDMRQQWLRRLLSMDQTDLSNRFAILMVSVRVGERTSEPSRWPGFRYCDIRGGCFFTVSTTGPETC